MIGGQRSSGGDLDVSVLDVGIVGSLKKSIFVLVAKMATLLIIVDYSL